MKINYQGIISVAFVMVAFVMMTVSVVLIWAEVQLPKSLNNDFDCYKFHVKECLSCHDKNLTYLLCSGFCVEPDEDDLNNNNTICVVHPQEDCFDLPMECNLK